MVASDPAAGGPPSRVAMRASSAAMRSVNCSFSSRAATTMSRKTSTSSRVAISMSFRRRSIWPLTTVSTSRRTPCAAPVASVTSRANSSRRRLEVEAMAAFLAHAASLTVMWYRRPRLATGLTQGSPSFTCDPQSRLTHAPPGHSLSGHRSHRDRDRPLCCPLVCARLRHGPARRLVLCAPPGAAGRVLGVAEASDAERYRRPDRLGGARRGARRADRLRAVLQLRILPGGAARNLRDLARRHVVPRRLRRRGRRAPAVRAVAAPERPLHARPCRRRDADRLVLRPHRQLHQRRIVGAARARLAVRRRVPPWRAGSAPSQPALRGSDRRFDPVYHPRHHGAALRLPEARPDWRRFRTRLRVGAYFLRVLPRAGPAARLPVRQIGRGAWRRDYDGHAAVCSDGDRWSGRDLAGGSGRDEAARPGGRARIVTALKRDLRNLIATEGPLTVAHYMALCLGHPRHGYYTTH